MRVFKFLLSTSLLLAVAGGIFFYLGREIWLHWAVSIVQNDYNQLKRIERDVQAYVGECNAKGAFIGNDRYPIAYVQLRFVARNSYNLEAVCQRLPQDPVIISTTELPWGVSTSSGDSGLIWGKTGRVRLEFWGRQREFAVNEIPLTVYSAQFGQVPDQPITQCVGYGFECCQAGADQGQGDQQTQALDCPQSCFASCVARPVVLQFSTDPFLDQQSRTVRIQAGQPINFAYVIDVAEPEVRGELDTGDGQKMSFSKPSGSMQHTYQCSHPECRYQVQLSATDSNGVASAQVPVSGLTVIVSGR